MVDLDTPGFYSYLFFAQKKNGEWMQILNLKRLNTFMVVSSIKLEMIQSVRNLHQIGEWVASVILKDVYLQIHIHRTFWKYLRFLFSGRACVAIQTSNASPCFYQGSKINSWTGTFVKSMNAYLSR